MLLLVGGTLGVGLDALHVHSGTTSYAAPWHGGIAWWTIPLFASAAVALGLIPTLLDRALDRARPAPSGARVAFGMLLFIAAYATSCVLRGAPCAVALTAIAVGLWWVCDRHPLGVAHALGAALFGTVFEITLVRAGAFRHHDAGLFGVALWLPCLYLSASLSTSALGRWLAQRGVVPFAG